MLKTLTYTSLARLDLDAQDLEAIHHSARTLNALDGITGLLVFDGSRFLQIVEGAPDAIDDLLARLRRDPRHSAIEVRDERPVEARAFPDWSMELLRVDAGFLTARHSIEGILPEATPVPIRDLVGRMSERLAIEM